MGDIGGPGGAREAAWSDPEKKAASERQEAQAARAELLRYARPEDTPPNPDDKDTGQGIPPGPPFAPEPGLLPTEAYIVGMDVVEDGVAVTILVPWPSVIFEQGQEPGTWTDGTKA